MRVVMIVDMTLGLLILGGYLLGAIPFAYIVSKFVGKVDIRSIGSGNVGATNVARALGMKWAAMTFLLDGAKGAGFVLILWQILPTWAHAQDSRQMILLAPIIGHCFSIFLKFSGGKGIATSGGVIAMIAPWGFLGSTFLYGVVTKLTRKSFMGSLSALCGFLLLDIFYFHSFWPMTLVILTALLVFQHRNNIKSIFK
jgi:acyl phosphate:glycerol-3-phosphate acyltransferase